jgi:hypothetical protein
MYNYLMRVRVDYIRPEPRIRRQYERDFLLDETVEIVPRASFAVVPGSISPESVGAGTITPIELTLDISGVTEVTLLGKKTKLSLSDGLVTSEASLELGEYEFDPGSHIIKTEPMIIPESWEGKNISGLLHLIGSEADILPLNVDLDFPTQMVVTGPPDLQILSLELDARNTPFVNQGQKFGLIGKIVNLASVDLPGPITITPVSDGSSTFIPTEMTLDKIAAGDTVAIGFEVIAPRRATAELYHLEVDAEGLDAIGTVDNDAIAIIQVPASLKLVGGIDENPGPVSIIKQGEPFEVFATILNIGESEIEGGTIVLDYTGPGDFGVEFPLEESIGDTIIWNLVAPNVDLSSHFTISWGGTPIDKNDGEPVESLGEQLNLPFAVKLSETRLIVHAASIEVMPLERGVSSRLFTLNLKNETDDNRNIIGLQSISMEITDRSGRKIDAGAIVTDTGSNFYVDNQPRAQSQIIDVNLVFQFADLNIISGLDVVAEFRLSPREDATVDRFVIRIDSGSFNAEIVSGPDAGQPVIVSSLFDQTFMIDIQEKIIDDEFAASFKNYPNPFNPNLESTEIIYVLPTDADVDIYIYTLTGQKVRHLHYKAGSNGGSQGLNSGLLWDGRNGSGEMVLSGAYIAMIDVGTENQTLTARLKMAVVR